MIDGVTCLTKELRLSVDATVWTGVFVTLEPRADLEPAVVRTHHHLNAAAAEDEFTRVNACGTHAEY